MSPALAVRDVSKTFGGVAALAGVDLHVGRGEVHGLVGENGSGKSTLIKIMAGFHAPDAGGELEVDGVIARLPLRPGEARAMGVGFVHQDLGLIPSLSVLENLRLGELAARRGSRIAWRAERRLARAALDRLGIDVELGVPVAALGVADRALVALARAVEDVGRRGVLVLDEVTAYLPRAERRRLLELVRSLAEEGTSTVFVSHDLEEVREVTDRATVLRDGRVVGTIDPARLERGALAELVTGRAAAGGGRRRRNLATDCCLAVRGLDGGSVHGLDFDVGSGEILGLTGLPGAGFEDVPYLLCGARRSRAGRLTLRGTVLDLTRVRPHHARRAGIVLLPADRLAEGAAGSLSVTDNVTLPSLDRYASGLLLDRRRMRVDATALVRRMSVRPADPALPFRVLSGGNQQKALLGRALAAKPSLLLFDSPTRGVDAGVRQQIVSLVREAVATGACAVCVTSDDEELATLCDRVLVLEHGRAVETVASV